VAAGEGPSDTRLVLKWGAAGLAGASLVTGVVFTILHSQNVSSFDQSCRVKGGMGVLNDATGTPDPGCNSKYQTSQTYQAVFIAGYAAAGAFAATWLILQLTEPSVSAVEHASRGPLCAPAFSGPGISCALRF
jgi:hypothetical protein